MITVFNLRTGSLPVGAVYVGRKNRTLPGSPLGNPYVLRNEAERAEVYADYDQWLQAQLVNPTSPQSREIARLVEIARTGDLTLACWCAPKLCHADVIKQVIEKRLQSPERTALQAILAWEEVHMSRFSQVAALAREGLGLPPVEPPPIDEAMAELREKFGHHFDGVDAVAFVKNIRGD